MGIISRDDSGPGSDWGVGLAGLEDEINVSSVRDIHPIDLKWKIVTL